MKKTMLWVLLLMLLLSAGGCGQEEVQEEESGDSAVAVEIQRVERGSIASESTVSGQVAAGDQESVFVATSAQCKDVYVEQGDTVSAGQTLFTLDITSTLDNIQTTNMSQAAAQKSFRDNMALMDQQLEQTNAQLEQANAQLEQAENQLAMVEKALSDTEALLAIGAASQLEVDQAQMAVDSAKIGVESARMGVDNVQLSINNLESSRRSAREQYNLSVQNTTTTLHQLEASLKGIDRAGNVKAPISGTVTSLNAFKGSFASPGAPMATIESTTDREVSAAVSEALVSKLKEGDRASVAVEAANVDFQGTITSIEDSANAATHLYGVKIAIPPEMARGMLSGMFAEVTFFTDAQNNVVVIPTEAIQTGVDGSYVYILDSENIAHRVPVETGLVGNGVTEITSGLEGGEALVTVGQFYLSDGSLARVVPHQEAAP